MGNSKQRAANALNKENRKMGLDMYLNGKKFLWTNWNEPSKNLTEDGFEVKEKILRLGYWRKHPNLHGFIVNTFAGGEDECQEIELSNADIRKIIDAVKAKALPHTTGFFFGVSDGSEDEETIEILERALKWVEDPNDDGPNGRESRSIVYQASW
jgi:hypothetical protein